jgi:PKD domain
MPFSFLIRISSSSSFALGAPIVSSDSLLKFSLTVKDEEGAISQPDIVNITVKHTNHPPKANAGPDQAVNEGHLATLDGSKSKDQDSSDSVKYLWKQASGPVVKLNNADTSVATFTAPSNISSDKVLEFTLAVRDSKNATSNDSVKVTDKYIPPLNKHPIADTGPDQTIKAGDLVYLNGTASKDQDGNIASYSWRQIGGPSVKLNGADTPVPSFTSPINTSSNTSLAFKLKVMDDEGLKNSAIGNVTELLSPELHIPDFTYENFTYGIKIQYPSSWKVHTGLNLFDENGIVQPIKIANISPPIEFNPNNRSGLHIGVDQLTIYDTRDLNVYVNSWC